MGSTSFNSRQFNNVLAREHFLLYDDTVARTGGYYQSNNEIFFAFFQNKQAVVDANTWNAWILNDARSGTAPAASDSKYPEYFNIDTTNWRNKLLYLVPATRLIMVKKDASGTIAYNGQNWSAITSWDEEAVTTGAENRYIYYECDLMYYDSALAVSTGITSKNIITGLGIYQTKLNGATGTIYSYEGTGWTSVNYDSGVTDYVYYTHGAINSKSASTVYDSGFFGTANLAFRYHDTFQSIIRSDTLHTVFSVIIEM